MKKLELMAMCKRPDLAPSSAYRYYMCRCKRCKEWKRDAAARTNNKERAIIRAREWRKNNPERSRYNSKRYQKNNPEKVLEWQLKKYNMSIDDYNLLVEKQNGVCAICGDKARGMQHSNNRLCIDHDDITGEVRGLLCGACNINHSVKLLKNAIKYLEENGDV